MPRRDRPIVMKQILRLTFCAFCLMPFSIHASAVKECLVDAKVIKVIESGVKPRVVIFANSAVFQGGHSLGTDCSELVGKNHEIQLDKAIPAPAKFQVLYRVVANEMTSTISESWELYTPPATNPLSYLRRATARLIV